MILLFEVLEGAFAYPLLPFVPVTALHSAVEGASLTPG